MRSKHWQQAFASYLAIKVQAQGRTEKSGTENDSSFPTLEEKVVPEDNPWKSNSD